MENEKEIEEVIEYGDITITANTKQISLRIDLFTLEKIKEVAKKSKLSVTELINRALKAVFIDEEEKIKKIYEAEVQKEAEEVEEFLKENKVKIENNILSELNRLTKLFKLWYIKRKKEMPSRRAISFLRGKIIRLMAEPEKPQI
jgi:hypothetical protein